MGKRTIFSPCSHETQWIIQIKDMYDQISVDQSELERLPAPCVYHVPSCLSSSSPESYVPQLIALGPYHHFRPELYPMERLKLTSAKTVLKHFQDFPLDKLITQLKTKAPHFRACYHKYLDLSDEILGYILAIDGIFYYHLLHTYVKKGIGGDSPVLLRGFPEMKTCIAGVKLTTDAILKDVLMLENQIPNYVLSNIFTTIISSYSTASDLSSVDGDLASVHLAFCRAVSPLPIVDKSPDDVRYTHVLDLMYHLILPSQDTPCQSSQSSQNTGSSTEGHLPASREETRWCSCSCTAIIHKLKVFIDSLKPCLTVLQTIKTPALKIIQCLGTFVQQASNLGQTPSTTEFFETPKVVSIPSVAQLHSGGIHFRSAKGDGGITSIEFDEKTGTFYLPKIRLDVNSEIVTRNLVAYEAMTKSESLMFTRYTELMRAIVDTEEDVELLVDNKIVVSSLGVGEVEKVFNGMRKSIGPTKTPHLDETIEKVNRYYNGTRRVKVKRWARKNANMCWRISTIFVTIVLLVLIGIQTFCSSYDTTCTSLFKKSSSS